MRRNCQIEKSTLVNNGRTYELYDWYSKNFSIFKNKLKIVSINSLICIKLSAQMVCESRMGEKNGKSKTKKNKNNMQQGMCS